ncbi:uncharacterized protein A1O9_06125 [Exophiala aquamarina CBS 119918]|uniref:Uncharacterized protein n=1 Tax=Exophiala aquamarina CBS 119918 TaxID=1182545 RepID=A0A072PDN4_9EURO|nr:uncharacterized protein A1O9_06125 [Exophiala aquamarina CBS 119918]KEF58199.1 hypothetical protein A1O9_06125 [Exophiala aquamarina CBS 119918]
MTVPGSSSYQHDSMRGWENVPVEYRPVQRSNPRPVSGYYASPALLPGPPPRPRTASPIRKLEAIRASSTPILLHPNPKTYRRRSALDVRNPWPGLPNPTPVDEAKMMSVEIAAALPPDHLDPPPPYSYYPPAPSLPPPPPPPPPPLARPHPSSTTTRHRSWSNQQQYAAAVNRYNGHTYYNPGDFQQQPIRTQAIQAIPSIGLPQPPTPVSPINTLDAQYLALRQARRRKAASDVTIDNLLGHPMLSQP